MIPVRFLAMRFSSCLVVFLVLTVGFYAAESITISLAATPASAKTVTLFSFDEHSIPHQRNLFLTLHPPRKYEGNPVVRHGGPGTPDEINEQFYGSVIDVGRTLRMWYLVANPESIKSQVVGSRQDSVLH